MQPAHVASRTELYDYIRATTDNVGKPVILLGHRINNCSVNGAGSCNNLLFVQPELLNSATQIAATVSGHYFLQGESSDPPINIGCECTSNVDRNQKNWAVIQHGFNFQDWEGVPSDKAPISLLIIDEDFNNNDGKLYVRNLNVYGGVGSEDWFEDADSSLEVTPIHFQQRRRVLCPDS